MKRSLGVLAATIGTVLSLAGPAAAQRDVVDDPAGDGYGHGLDVVHVSVDNRDHAIVSRITFVESTRGDLVLSIDPRDGRGVRVVSRYRPVAHTSNVVLGRAFSDRRGFRGPIDCPGLRVRWSADEPAVRIVLPASCLAGGDYGAIRYAVLTEGTHGSDTDTAPDDGVSGWVARG